MNSTKLFLKANNFECPNVCGIYSLKPFSVSKITR